LPTLELRNRRADAQFRARASLQPLCYCANIDAGIPWTSLKLMRPLIAALMKSEILKKAFRPRPPKQLQSYIIDEVHMLTGAAFNALLKH